MRIVVLILGALAFSLMASCQSQVETATKENAKTTLNTKTSNKANLKEEVSAEKSQSANQDLPPMPVSITSFLDKKDIADKYEVHETVSLQKIPMQDKMARSAIFRWNSGTEGLTFLLQGYNPAKSTEPRFKKTLDFLEKNGEPRSPDPRDSVKVNYIPKADIGDQAIWSAEDRILKWRIGESYFCTLMRTPHKSTSEEQDRITLQEYAVRISFLLNKGLKD